MMANCHYPFARLCRFPIVMSPWSSIFPLDYYLVRALSRLMSARTARVVDFCTTTIFLCYYALYSFAPLILSHHFDDNVTNTRVGLITTLCSPSESFTMGNRQEKRKIKKMPLSNRYKMYMNLIGAVRAWTIIEWSGVGDQRVRIVYLDVSMEMITFD